MAFAMHMQQTPVSTPFYTPPGSAQDPPPESSNSTQPPQLTRGYRYSAYSKGTGFRPLTSSPLTHVVVSPNANMGYDDDDDEDEDQYSAHVPSSPLGRVSGSSTSSTSFNFHLGSSSTRRRKSEDADDPSALFQRRRTQYKSRESGRRVPSSPPISAPLFQTPTDAPEDPRRAFLRDRFKKRYFARATKAREDAVKAGRRHPKGKAKATEDDDDDGMDADEEADDSIMNDELFSRIVSSMNRKEQHKYRLSYAREVGSSFDPDIEDVSRWEEELVGASALQVYSPSKGGQRDIGSSPPRAPTEYEFDGEADVEDAEVEAYAEEYARVAEEQERKQQQEQPELDDVLAGLEDIPEEELFGAWNWSESDGEGVGARDEDVDMDL